MLTADFPSLLRPGVMTTFENYMTQPLLFSPIYTTRHTRLSVDYDVEFQGLGSADVKPQAGAPIVQDMRQKFMTPYVQTVYGIAFQISKEAIEDVLYWDQLPSQNEHLRRALEELKNQNGMFVFNNAFNANSTGGDGFPLASTQHPIEGGVLSNTYVDSTTPGQSSLQDANIMIQLWRNVAGQQMNLSSKMLLCHPYYSFLMKELVDSKFSPETPNNAINVLNEGYFPKGILSNPFLYSPYAWFMLTNAQNGFKHVIKNGLSIDFNADTFVGVLTVAGSERYCFGYSDWRGAVCCAGI